ncbi:MAG: type VI secretion system tip protein VgrG [Campylobacter sp.]|nr:type VI secretion system tip protein VgrG [Campylobacter sp.]
MNSYLSLSIRDAKTTPFTNNLVLTKISVNESLDDIFSIECEGYSKNSIDNPIFAAMTKTEQNQDNPYALLNNVVEIKVKKPEIDKANSISSNTNEKIYNGIITDITFLGTNDDKNSNSALNLADVKFMFKLKISSFLYRLSINKANRIFTNLSVIDVIKQVLALNTHHQLKEYDFTNIYESYEPKEYISQKNESDLDFIKRLCASNALYFYEDENKVYFYDENIFLTDKDGKNVYIYSPSQNSQTKDIKFNSNPNNAFNDECIKQINKNEHLSTDSFTTSMQNPAFPLRIFSELKNTSLASFDSLTHHDQFSFTQSNKLNFESLIESLRANLKLNTYNAHSNVFGLKLNDSINLSTQISSEKYNFRIIAQKQTFIDEAVLANQANTNDNLNLKDKSMQTSYHNELSIIPTTIPYISKAIAKPSANTLSLGIVIGDEEDPDSKKNTIFTDEYGRIRVRINEFITQEIIDKKNMHKLSQNKTNETKKINNTYSTTYLRVITPIASSDSGFFAIPRIGDEVVISYLQNDIDKPIIIGSLYNSYNKQLSNLPNNYHQTTLSSKTIGTNENGRNELTLSNLKDKEQIYLKAEKDYDELINHNFTQHILNDKYSTTDGNYTERIKQAHIQTIDLAKNVNVGAEYLTMVGASKDTIVGISNTLNVGLNNKLRVAKDSSEYIGNDKSVEIKGNLETIIDKDETRTVNKNSNHTIKGSMQLNISEGINLQSEEQAIIQANGYLDIKTSDNIKIEASSQHTEKAESKFSNIASNYEVDAGTQIIHKVGTSQVIITNNNVVIKAGGVDVVIDSSGLTVIGGEIKGE